MKNKDFYPEDDVVLMTEMTGLIPAKEQPEDDYADIYPLSEAEKVSKEDIKIDTIKK